MDAGVQGRQSIVLIMNNARLEEHHASLVVVDSRMTLDLNVARATKMKYQLIAVVTVHAAMRGKLMRPAALECERRGIKKMAKSFAMPGWNALAGAATLEMDLRGDLAIPAEFHNLRFYVISNHTSPDMRFQGEMAGF